MKLLHLTIILLLTFSFEYASGQNSSENLDSLVGNYVKDLNSNNIDTVCIYQDYFIGGEIVFDNKEDTCYYDGLFITTYIFWIKNGQTFMTEKDNCFDYSIVKIEKDNIFNFFFANSNIIKKERIKVPQYSIIENKKTKTYSTYIDHSAPKGIRMLIRNDTLINKDLNEYYFIKQIGADNHLNINYDYNMNSYLRQFQILIDKTVDAEITKNKLTKSRR